MQLQESYTIPISDTALYTKICEILGRDMSYPCVVERMELEEFAQLTSDPCEYFNNELSGWAYRILGMLKPHFHGPLVIYCGNGYSWV